MNVIAAFIRTIKIALGEIVRAFLNPATIPPFRPIYSNFAFMVAFYGNDNIRYSLMCFASSRFFISHNNQEKISSRISSWILLVQL